MLTFGIMVNRSSVRSVLIFISKSPTSAGEGGERLAGVIEGTTICGRRCGDCVVTLVAAEPADRRESPIRLLKGEFLSYQGMHEQEKEGQLTSHCLESCSFLNLSDSASLSHTKFDPARPFDLRLDYVARHPRRPSPV